MLKFYNTLTRTIEEFKPINPKEVRMYTCGPTVYNYAHIGNLRTYIFEDLLRRVLEYNGYKVIHAMNITDVGHLVGDGDEGEDKLEVSAKKEHKDPWEITKFYSDEFFKDRADLNIFYPSSVIKASDTISEEIEIIKILEEKGYTYKGENAIYFDVSKFPDYNKLSRQELSEKKVGAREGVVLDKEKKHPADFALWFFLIGKHKNHLMHWPSPWGEGFPGWHIECSAISRKLLGQPFDIHCGGIDLILPHHTNEIAQSEAAFGVPLANFWMYGEHLLINSGRMGKSEGNLVTLSELKNKGFSPLDFRYFCLNAHYRTQLNFTWESLLAAHNALEKLYQFVLSAKSGQAGCAEYEQKFNNAVNDDLNIPRALGIIWELIDELTLPTEAKINTLLKFDRIMGLNLANSPLPILVVDDVKVKELLDLRLQAREKKDFAKSDHLRKQIEALGYEVSDTSEGQKIKKKIKI